MNEDPTPQALRDRFDRLVPPIALSELDGARVNRTGRVPRSLLLAAAAIVLIGTVGAGVLLAQRSDPSAVAPPVSEPDSSTLEWPGIEIVGDEAHLPFTLLDGTTGTLVYPSDILEGAQITLNDSASCNHRCAREYGFSDVVAVRGRDPFADRPVLTSYEGVDGAAVELVDASVDRLIYRFGPWSVILHTGAMSADDPALWARSLTADVTPSGWLLVHSLAPITLGLAGERNPSLDLDVRGLNISVTAIACGQRFGATGTEPVDSGTPGQEASYFECLSEDLAMAVHGDAELVSQIEGAISVENLTRPT